MTIDSAAERVVSTKLCTALLLLILFAGLSVQAALSKMSLYHGGKENSNTSELERAAK